MKRPKYLTPGDKIAFAAPARKATFDSIKPSIRLFESWGLEVIIPDDLFAQQNQFAGSTETRANLFQQLLDDPSINAIICARGGYGTVHIIDKLDFTRFSQQPKWVVGYSDITVLHSHIHQNYGIETLHATMPLNIPDDFDKKTYPAIETLRKALFGEDILYSFPNNDLNRRGIAQGEIVGGNLSILYSLCGSPSAIDTRGKILMIEDLDEYLYHIDRMMMNLKRNGTLANLAGLIVGQFSNMLDNNIPFGKNANEIIYDMVKEYSYPVCFDIPVGHNETDNHALPLGRVATLDISEKVTLTIPR